MHRKETTISCDFCDRKITIPRTADRAIARVLQAIKWAYSGQGRGSCFHCNRVWAGWISYEDLTREEAIRQLHEIGVTIYDKDSESMFLDVRLPGNVLDRLDLLWGTFVWGLEEETDPAKSRIQAEARQEAEHGRTKQWPGPIGPRKLRTDIRTR